MVGCYSWLVGDSSDATSGPLSRLLVRRAMVGVSVGGDVLVVLGSNLAVPWALSQPHSLPQQSG